MVFNYLTKPGDWMYAKNLYLLLVNAYKAAGKGNPEKRAAGSIGGSVTQDRLRLVIRRNRLAFERIL